VIGSGPSGLSGAAELGRLGYEVTVLEEFPVPGGILAGGIPQHKLPKDIVQAEIDYISQMNVHFELNSPITAPSTIDDFLEQGYGAVFVGVGLGKPASLSVPGEHLVGVYNWREVLSWLNIHRVQTPEEGVINLGKRVVVIGGGNVAVDVATSALRLGAEEVHLVCLEAIDEMPAFKYEVSDAVEEGVIIHPRSRVSSIIGTDDGKVGGVEGTGIKWKKENDFSPENAVPVTGSNFSLGVDSVVEAIGQSLDRERSQFLATLEMKGGYIVINQETGETSRPGVFAGGDAVRGSGTVVQSVHDGVIAARAIDKYLQDNR
jgi:glutamate synthase (NADPH/NADH) small chain